MKPAASAHSQKRMGTLYLVPTPLDFGCDSQGPLHEVLPQATIVRAAALQHWVCENAKSARAFLKRIGDVSPLCASIQEQQLQELPREVHKKGDVGFDARSLLAPALQGLDMGLLSEAGMPASVKESISAWTSGARFRPLCQPEVFWLRLNSRRRLASSSRIRSMISRPRRLSRS